MSHSAETNSEIIQFPVRPAAGPVRLQRAVSGLLAALDEQKLAVANWRATLGDLRNAVERLGAGIEAYSARIAKISLGMEEVNH